MADYDNPRPSSQPTGSTEGAVAKDNLITLDNVMTAPTGTEITNRKGEALTPMVDIVGAAQGVVQAAVDAVAADTIQNTDDIAAIQADYASVLKAVAISAGTTIENVMLATNKLDPVVGFIYDADEQVTYSVPSDAQGKFIDSVVGRVLTTTDASVYYLPLATNTTIENVADHVEIEGATNNTSAMEELSEEFSGQSLLLNDEVIVDDDVQCEDVIYQGTGSFNTKNTPNSPTVGLSSTLGGGFNSISPDRHFRQASATAANNESVKVVIMGDSLSTPYADVDEYMEASSDNLWGYLQRGLKKTNPYIDFNFVNRGIGGRTFTSANGNEYGTTPANIDWYTEDKNWFDYIIDEEPDILILSFGMNDRENIGVVQFRALMTKVLSMSKIPDVVFCTNMVPSRMTSDSNISSPKSNEGRDFASGYVRYYAQRNDMALIDINRQYHLVKDGCDVENTYMEKVQSDVAITAPHSFDDYLCSNFTLDIEISSLDSGVLNDLETEGLDRLRIYTSPQRGTNNPNSTSFIELGTIGGNLAVEVADVYNSGFNVNYGYGYEWLDTGVIAPSVGSSFRLTVTVKGGNLVIALDNDVILNEQIQRLGQAFAPAISSRLETIAQAMSVTLYQGKYTKICHPLMTDSEIWDSYKGGNTGGNGLNHPNTRAISCIYGPAVDSSDLRIPSFTSGATPYKATKKRGFGVGQAKPVGMFHVGDGTSTANVAGDSSDIVFQGENSVGSSYCAEDGGVYRNRVSTPSNQNAFLEAFNSSTLQHTIAIDGVTVEQRTSTPATSSTGTAILINRAGVLSLEFIKIGAEDSGGTGFRSLMITN